MSTPDLLLVPSVCSLLMIPLKRFLYCGRHANSAGDCSSMEVVYQYHPKQSATLSAKATAVAP
jgi:hypothetical protein